jgi:hypothetical protein
MFVRGYEFVVRPCGFIEDNQRVIMAFFRENYPATPLAYAAFAARSMYDSWFQTPAEEIEEWFTGFIDDLESREQDAL